MKIGLKIVVILFFLTSMPIKIDCFNEDFVIHFREGRVEELLKILESGDNECSEIQLYKAMIMGYRKDYMNANVYLIRVKDNAKINKVRIIAEYLLSVMKINEGYKVFIESLENDYWENIVDGDYATAFEKMTILISLDPLNPEYRLNMGKISLMIGFPYKAIIEGSIALALKPEKKEIVYESIYTVGRGFHQYYLSEYQEYFDKFQHDNLIGVGLVPLSLLEKSISTLLELISNPDIPDELKKEVNLLIQRLRFLIIQKRNEKYRIWNRPPKRR